MVHNSKVCILCNSHYTLSCQHYDSSTLFSSDPISITKMISSNYPTTMGIPQVVVNYISPSYIMVITINILIYQYITILCHGDHNIYSDLTIRHHLMSWWSQSTLWYDCKSHQVYPLNGLDFILLFINIIRKEFLSIILLTY